MGIVRKVIDSIKNWMEKREKINAEINQVRDEERLIQNKRIAKAKVKFKADKIIENMKKKPLKNEDPFSMENKFGELPRWMKDI